MNEFFKLLKQDHIEVKDILEQLDETSENGATTKKREQLFQQLKEELVPHMKAEEGVFYTPLMEKKEAREDALEGMEEHHVSELVLKELDKMPKGDDKWAAKMRVFKELVDHHIKDEESNIFKSAKKAFDRDERHTIMTKFEQEKQKIRKNLR
jgi:hemerythrin-like domain-containing protein